MTAITPKAWGYEWAAFDNGKCAVCVLHIARKRKTSLHCHPRKKTTLIVLSGIVRFSSGALSTDLESTVIEPLGSVVIPMGMWHRTECIGDSDIYPTSENGAWLLEIEEPSDKNDLVRIEDAYGRQGTPYETDLVSYSGELLQLSKSPQKFLGYSLQLWGREPVGDLVIPIGHRDDVTFLTITKDSTVKLTDYVADFIADLGIRHVFSVVGGGSMHLCDSFGNHERIKYVPTHHEQAAAMAAESYARVSTAGIGCCCVTTGPGGTNSVTGVSCAWIDSTPVIFISGQVTRDTLLEGTGVRQFGVQETDIVTLVKSITKYAVTITDEKDIRYELEKAVYIARSGRPGPVWLDLPLDVQSKQIDPVTLRGYYTHPLFNGHPIIWGNTTERSLSMLSDAKRPVLIVGNGVRLAGAQAEIRELVEALGIPVISSWTAADMIADSPYHIGHMGIFGDRASNFTVQNADLLLVIGCRLSVPQIGYNFSTFARAAKIIMVDVDKAEMDKPSLHVDLKIVADAKDFVKSVLSLRPFIPNDTIGLMLSVSHVFWLGQCQEWRAKYPVVLPEYADTNGEINSFYFVDLLSKALPDDAIVVLDQGTAFTCTFQAATMKYGQRWIAASGCAPMGYGLPGAIGAHYATGKKVVCIVGDGALQFNVQELQTIAHNNLPIIIFVLNNSGYLSIKLMQQNHFGRMVGSEAGSGVSFPDLAKIAMAYNISHYPICDVDDLKLELDVSENGPFIYEIMMPPDQALIPRLSSLKRPDGSIVSHPLEQLFPFLPKAEFEQNMIVPSVEVLG